MSRQFELTAEASQAMFDVSQAPGRAISEISRTVDRFWTYESEEGRAAFADKWLTICAHSFDYTWPVFYELLRIVRDRKLFARSQALEGGVQFASFEEYFEKRVGKPFATWSELEKTYRFVHDCKPELFRSSFETAQAERAAYAQAVDADTRKKQRSRGGDRRSEEFKSNNVPFETPAGNSAAKALRRLRKHRTDLHQKVLSGEMSAHAAAVEAGFRHRMLNVRADDVNAAVASLVRCYGKRSVVMAVGRL